jgi:hypothetical protein
MNLENNIGENKYEHIYVFGCSHSLNTNSIDNTCKTYSEIIADKLGISYTNVYNYSINGSSNFQNLYYLNCINSELSYYHSFNDRRHTLLGSKLPNKIYDNSLIIFQLTYWGRNVFQHTIHKEGNEYELIPLSPHREYDDIDITKLNETYYKKLSNSEYLQRNSILPIYHTLKTISSEKNNVSTILMAWDRVMDDNIQNYIHKELTNIQHISIENRWSCHFKLFNDDMHLSPEGNEEFAEYLMNHITH